MCIAIHKPKEVIIPKETLEECFNSNADGAGFMFSENGALTIYKGFFDFPSFYAAYKEHENKLCVLHFRIKTHGKIDKANCHPFSVSPTLAFVHNGVISGFGTVEYNDSYMFNEEILKKIIKHGGKKLLFSEIIKKLLEKSIGYSKLIFLDAYGKVSIFNEHMGEWNNGAWYSNTSYKPKLGHSYKHGNSGYLGEDFPTHRKHISQKKVVPINDKFFIRKPDYQQDIHDGDWVKVNANCRGILKGALAFVEKVNGNGFCDLVFPDGSTIKQFPGRLLDYIDWEEGESLLLLEEY